MQESVTASWQFPAGLSASKFVVDLGTGDTVSTTLVGIDEDCGAVQLPAYAPCQRVCQSCSHICLLSIDSPSVTH
jgi:hypothetical protein